MAVRTGLALVLGAWIAGSGGCSGVRARAPESPASAGAGKDSASDSGASSGSSTDAVPWTAPVIPGSCASLLGDAAGRARAELLLLCATSNHDGSCVGMYCARTEPREAFECLLAEHQADRVIALATASEPAARAYAREAMDRASAWTVERIADAMGDTAVVEACAGCTCDIEPLARAGLAAALAHEDRAGVTPILRAWAAHGTPAGLYDALIRRGDEPWIDSERLHTLLADSSADGGIRVAAAYALALRGESPSITSLYALAAAPRSGTREYAVRTLDKLGAVDAWERLASLRNDDYWRVRAAWLRLGAHHAPRQAAPVIDSLRTYGSSAAAALPPKLFASRAATAVCDFDPFHTEYEGELAAALRKLPKRVRCRALRAEACHDPSQSSLAFSIAPQLAADCGITAEPARDSSAPDFRGCHRKLAVQLREFEAAERVRLLEIERRAKATAGQ